MWYNIYIVREISPDLEVIVSKTPGNDGGEMTNMTEEGSVRFLFIWTDYSLTLAPAKICSKFCSGFCRKCTKPRECELI